MPRKTGNQYLGFALSHNSYHYHTPEFAQNLALSSTSNINVHEQFSSLRNKSKTRQNFHPRHISKEQTTS
jgi:hypothetical protein